jgi:hypothetical protein
MLGRRLTLVGAGTVLISAVAWIGAAVDGGGPLVTLATIGAFAAGLALLVYAVAAQDANLVEKPLTPVGRIGARALWALVALSCVATAALVAGLLLAPSPKAPYNSDAAAFNHYNAELVLRGVNPYTADVRFWDAVRQFPDAGATPLRAGRYAGSTFGPSLDQVVADVKDELMHPAHRGPEYAPASLHSYPALAFLVYVPGVWLGLPSTVLSSLVFLMGFLLACSWGASRGSRLATVAVLLAGSLLIIGTLRGSFEAVALLPVVLAWRTLDRRWPSAVLLGLGCAVKQVVWPLALLYGLLIWRRHGGREAARRMGVAACAFLLPNLPFVIASPGAWLRSLFLPMTLPIFPSGVGLIDLAQAGLLPIFPPAVYAALELAALAGLALWIVRGRQMPQPGLVLVVGLLPLALAWHSIFAYFVAIPALAVYAVIKRERDVVRGGSAPVLTANASTER